MNIMKPMNYLYQFQRSDRIDFSPEMGKIRPRISKVVVISEPIRIGRLLKIQEASELINGIPEVAWEPLPGGHENELWLFISTPFPGPIALCPRRAQYARGSWHSRRVHAYLCRVLTIFAVHYASRKSWRPGKGANDALSSPLFFSGKIGREAEYNLLRLGFIKSHLSRKMRIRKILTIIEFWNHLRTC